MEKKVIYDSSSFANVIEEINTHVLSIKDSFNDKFTLESYEGTNKDKIETSMQKLLDNLNVFMNGLDDIVGLMNGYKVKYDEVINSNKSSVNGGDINV